MILAFVAIIFFLSGGGWTQERIDGTTDRPQPRPTVPWPEIQHALMSAPSPTDSQGRHRRLLELQGPLLGRVKALRNKGDIVPGVIQRLDSIAPGRVEAEWELYYLILLLKEDSDERLLASLDRLGRMTPSVSARRPEEAIRYAFPFHEAARELADKIRLRAAVRAWNARVGRSHPAERALALGRVVWRITPPKDEWELRACADLLRQTEPVLWWPHLVQNLPRNIRSPSEKEKLRLRAMLSWARLGIQLGIDNGELDGFVQDGLLSEEARFRAWAKEVVKERERAR